MWSSWWCPRGRLLVRGEGAMNVRLKTVPLLPADAYRKPELDDEDYVDLDVALERYIDPLLDRLTGAELAELPKLGPGSCHDCGTDSRRRVVYGDRGLELCRRC